MLFWRLTLLALWLTGLAQAAISSGDWQVSSVVRTIDLAGSVASWTDVHVVRPPSGQSEPSSDDQVKPYFFALSQRDAAKVSGIEASARFGVGLTPKQRAILPVQDEGLLDTFMGLASSNATALLEDQVHLYSVQFPAAFLRKAHPQEPLPDTTLSITGYMVHASEPLPKTIAQSEAQYLVWHGEADVVPIYPLQSARVKVR